MRKECGNMMCILKKEQNPGACYIHDEVVFQAQNGGYRDPGLTTARQSKDESAPYWGMETWFNFTNRTELMARREHCEQLNSVRQLLKDATKSKKRNGELV